MAPTYSSHHLNGKTVLPHGIERYQDSGTKGSRINAGSTASGSSQWMPASTIETVSIGCKTGVEYMH